MRALLAVIASLFLCAAPSAACSVDESYKQPTNFELVQKAKVIVLARIGSVPASPDASEQSHLSQMVTLEPIRFLKGSATPDGLRLMGWRPPKNWEGVSTATTLWQSHFSAGLGACVRQFYEPGELVVAMFESEARAKEITGQELNQIFDPWARVVETVDGTDDVWVRAVERYVALQAGDPATIKERIESEIQQLRSVVSPEAQSIAADLEYYLRRGNRSGTWGSFSMPTFTAAGIPGQDGAQLYCIAGTPPGLMLAQGQSTETPRVVVDGVSYGAAATSPTHAEAEMLQDSGRRLADKPEKAQPPSIYRLNDPAVLSGLRSATKSVAIEIAGKPTISGQPLDALLRWVSQCEKLQKIPPPSAQERH